MPTTEDPHGRDASRLLTHWTAWITFISMIISAITNAIVIIHNIGSA